MWWPPAARPNLLPPWSVLFLAACALAWAGGIVKGPALAGLVLLALSCVAAQRAPPRTAPAARWLAAGLALVLALHAWPGFDALSLVEGLRLGADARPFTLRAGFDKAAAGLFLLAFFAPRTSSWAQLHRDLASVLSIAVLTLITTLGLAWLTGFVRPDPKWPPVAAQFLLINLLFTCVAEEAFFRGVIQESLQRGHASRMLTLLLPALLFGAAHLPGGLLHASLAGVAGIGYGLAYAQTRRIEAAVLCHFAVNAVHFLGFTYPGLAG